MISYIKGELSAVSSGSAIVDNNGVGYMIYISRRHLSELPSIGSTVKVYTYMSVKDDGITLFGFQSSEELSMFNQLITVSGVGPRAAQALLEQLRPDELIMAIVTEDAALLSKAQGVGKKTALRVILELKGRFKTEDCIAASGKRPDAENLGPESGSRYEAVEALIALGYGRAEAAGAVSRTSTESGLTAGAILKEALKIISSKV